VSLTSNWNIWDEFVQMAFSTVASTTIAVFELSIPDSDRVIGHPLPAPPHNLTAFGSCSAPHPILRITGRRAHSLNRTVRGLRNCF
jgi:hypothetical protein